MTNVPRRDVISSTYVTTCRMMDFAKNLETSLGVLRSNDFTELTIFSGGGVGRYTFLDVYTESGRSTLASRGGW